MPPYSALIGNGFAAPRQFRDGSGVKILPAESLWWCVDAVNYGRYSQLVVLILGVEGLAMDRRFRQDAFRAI